MSVTRQTTTAGRERQHAHKSNRSNRRNRIPAGWIKKGGALVGFLSTCIALVVAAQNLVTSSGGPNTSIDTDEQLQMKIVKADGDEFLFRLALTLLNQGGKPDTIHRPHASLQSDLGAITYSDEDVNFADENGKELDFPLILQKNSPARLICTIKWKPAGSYPGWAGEGSHGDGTPVGLTGRIELTGMGKARKPIKRQFGLVAAATIRGLKPTDPPQAINYLYIDGDEPDIGEAGSVSDAPLSIFSSRIHVCAAMGIRQNNITPLATIGISAVAAPAVSVRYAGRGEIASGKEVPSSNANQVGVNLRPCGGEEVLVIFNAPYKKTVMGKLPCGVVMIQVEQR